LAVVGTANVSGNVAFAGQTFTSTANITSTAASQQFRSNGSITVLAISGNGITSNTTLAGNLVTISANLVVSGTNHTVAGNVNFDSGTVFVDADTNRLGVNTASPDRALLVIGSARFSEAANVGSTLGVGTNATIGGFINVATTANVGGVANFRANVVSNGQLIVANTASLGSTTITGFVDASTYANVGTTLTVGTNATIGGFANVVGSANVGTTLRVGSTSNLVGNVSIGGNATINSDYVIDVVANGDIGTTASPRLIYSFPKATYRTGKLMVQATNAGNNQIAEMVVAHDGTDAYVAVYGVVASPPASGGANTAAPLGTFTAAVNGANVDITMAQLRNNSAVKIVAHLIK
jgi:hypothetical protein